MGIEILIAMESSTTSTAIPAHQDNMAEDKLVDSENPDQAVADDSTKNQSSEKEENGEVLQQLLIKKETEDSLKPEDSVSEGEISSSEGKLSLENVSSPNDGSSSEKENKTKSDLESISSEEMKDPEFYEFLKQLSTNPDLLKVIKNEYKIVQERKESSPRFLAPDMTVVRDLRQILQKKRQKNIPLLNFIKLEKEKDIEKESPCQIEENTYTQEAQTSKDSGVERNEREALDDFVDKLLDINRDVTDNDNKRKVDSESKSKSKKQETEKERIAVRKDDRELRRRRTPERDRSRERDRSKERNRSRERDRSKERDRSRERREDLLDRDRRRRRRSPSRERDRYPSSSYRRRRASPSPRRRRSSSPSERKRDRKSDPKSPLRRSRQNAKYKSPSPRSSRDSNRTVRNVKNMSVSQSLKITFNRERSDSWEEEIMGYEDSKKLVKKKTKTNKKDDDIEAISLSSSDESNSKRKRSNSKENMNRDNISLTPSPEWKSKKQSPLSLPPRSNSKSRSRTRSRSRSKSRSRSGSRSRSHYKDRSKRRRSTSADRKPKKAKLPFIFEVTQQLMANEQKKNKDSNFKPSDNPAFNRPLTEFERYQPYRERLLEQKRQEAKSQQQQQHLSQQPVLQQQVPSQQEITSQQLPPQHLPPNQLPSQQMPPNQLPPQQMPPNQLAPQQMPPNQLPPQQMPPNQLAPQQMPPNQLAPQQMPPNQLAPQQMPPNQLPAQQMPPHQIPPHQFPLHQMAAHQQVPPHQVPPHQQPVQYPDWSNMAQGNSIPLQPVLAQRLYDPAQYPGIDPSYHMPPHLFYNMVPGNPNYYGPQSIANQPQPKPHPQLNPPQSHLELNPPQPQPQPNPPQLHPQPNPPQPQHSPQRQPSPPGDELIEILSSPGSPDIEILPPPLKNFKASISSETSDLRNEEPKETPAEVDKAPVSNFSSSPSSHIREIGTLNEDSERDTDFILTTPGVPVNDIIVTPMQISFSDENEESQQYVKKVVQILQDQSMSSTSKDEAIKQYRKEIEKKRLEAKELEEMQKTLGISKSRSGVRKSTPVRPAKKSTNLESNSGEKLTTSILKNAADALRGSQSEAKSPADQSPKRSDNSVGNIKIDSSKSEATARDLTIIRIENAVKMLKEDGPAAPSGRFILYPLNNPNEPRIEESENISPLLRNRGTIRFTDPCQEVESDNVLEGKSDVDFSFYNEEDSDESPELDDLEELAIRVSQKVNTNETVVQRSVDSSQLVFTHASASQCDFTTKAITTLQSKNHELKKANANITNKNANLTESYKNLKIGYEQKKEALNEAHKKLAERDTEIKSLKEQLLKGNKGEGRTHIAAAEIKTLCYKLSQKEKEISQKDKEINALKKTVMELCNDKEKIMVNRLTQTPETEGTAKGSKKQVACQASVEKRARNTQTDESSFTSSSSVPEDSLATSSKEKLKAYNEEVRKKFSTSNTSKGGSKKK